MRSKLTDALHDVFASRILIIALACLGLTAAYATGYRLEPITDELVKPVAVISLDDGRLLVSQLEGQVMVVEDGAVRPEPFLDLGDRVTALVGEQGFFSVALEDPAAAAERSRTPLLIAAYTERDSGDLIIAAYPTDARLSRADASAEQVLLRIAMPEPFHHGGQVAFGPDGMLYVSVGNGESANRFLHERPWSSQALDRLRGKLLRLDVGAVGAGRGYAVPADNPFVSDPLARPEIYALGFRNPWKFTFDPDSGRLLLVDVGNDRWEEVNVVRPGGNYGWPAREGRECQACPDAPGLVDPECPYTVFAEPVAVYGHLALDPAGGQAVTGGVVVRDPELPELRGRYLFADFVVGRIWALDLASGEVVELLDSDLPITHLSRGPAGEVLVLSITGVLARLSPAAR
ncbi:MAG TPA: PQQ-dependent sugar dehydrogenase [Trueperaceae bacterium]|nr:PQQ-dependent sugar dehydrogenase [Trueperaceae bacterium]